MKKYFLPLLYLQKYIFTHTCFNQSIKPVTMKKVIFIAICAVLTLVSKAQTNTEELRYLQSMFGMEKKQLVAERMKLSEAESAKFWSLYEEYELFRSEISDRRAANIQQYVKNYANITTAKADELMKNTFEINDETAKLWQKTYKSMSKELSSVIAGQFIYLEMYFEAIGREKLAETIPHIGENKPIK
jgi:hypothetical protein